MNASVKSWEERDLSSVLHGFTHLGSLHDNGPNVITHGEGIYVFDTQGKKYIEGNSGLWNVVAGFNNQGIANAAHQQIDKFGAYHAFFGRITEPAIELAEKLVDIAPVKMSKVFFTNSGSEANDTVVKILWMINKGLGRPDCRKIITRKGAYHGVTAISASMTGKDYNEVFGLPLDGFLHTDCPHYWRFSNEGESELQFSIRLANNLEKLIEKEGSETIAGFFAEPVLGAGGVIPPPKGYFENIQPVLKKYNIPLIADEVICGFGRTGNVWGCQTYNITPDIIISSKCLTAGYYPMAAILINEHIYDQLMEVSGVPEEFPHGFTSGGHPVGCAIAIKALKVILEEGVFENLKTVAPTFQSRLQECLDHPNIGEARGVGLMGALELVSNPETKASFPSENPVAEKIAIKALENGLICRPLGQAIVLAPPFIITEAQIHELFDKLQMTVDQVIV